VVARNNGAVKINLAFVLACLVTCAAGVLSCSGQSANPSGIEADASGTAKDAGGDSAILSGSEAGAPIPDAAGLDAAGPEAWGPETTLPVDAGLDRAPVGGESDVAASEAGVASDVATVDGAGPKDAPDGGGNLRGDAGLDAPAALPDGGGSFGGDAGLEAPAKDANATEARAPDVTPLDASAPDAKVDGAAADVMVMDSTVDSSTPSLDAGPAQCGRIKCDCTYNGVKLWGKVQYVDIFPDFKVKVSPFPDLNVEETYFGLKCGQWEIVTAFPDFTVQKVTMFEDFDIAYSPFPGIP
jgi:hypothetical protein